MPRVQRKQQICWICPNSHKNLGVFLPQTHVIQMTPNLPIKSKDLLDMSDIQISKNRRNLGVFLHRNDSQFTHQLIKVKRIVGYAQYSNFKEYKEFRIFLAPQRTSLK